MKKVILLTAILMTGFAASAQTWSDDVQFGVRGGLNFSTVTGDDFDSPDGRTSFYAGLLAELPLSDLVSLQPEVFYSAQGYDVSSGAVDSSYNLDYVQVPVLLKVYLIDGLNLQAGPQFGFKVNEDIDFDTNQGTLDFDTDAVNTFDFQLSAGAEYKLFSKIFVQARYTYGFTDVIDNVEARNSVVSAGIGYIF